MCFKQIAESVANLVGAGPSGGPLGGFKPAGRIISDVAAVAAAPATGGLSLALPLGRGAYDLSQGNTVGGILDLIGAGVGGFNTFGGLGEAATAGTGAADTAASGSEGGASLADFSGAAGSTAGGAAGAAAPAAAGGVGSTVSSGWQGLLNYLGLGSGGTTTGAAAGAPTDLLAGTPGATAAAPNIGDFTALSPNSVSELTSANPAGTAAINAVTGGPGAATSGGGILDTIMGFQKAHPILSLGGGLVGSQLLSPLLQKITGSGLTSQEKAMLANVQPGISAANQLVGSEASGVLPPGAEASVDQALQGDIANIKSRYASMGLSGSSAEQQDIANATQTAAGQKFGLSQQATQTGLNALGLTSNVYGTLVSDQLTRQQQLQNAFAGFFNALGVGTALKSAA